MERGQAADWGIVPPLFLVPVEVALEEATEVQEQPRQGSAQVVVLAKDPLCIIEMHFMSTLESRPTVGAAAHEIHEYMRNDV